MRDLPPKGPGAMRESQERFRPAKDLRASQERFFKQQTPREDTDGFGRPLLRGVDGSERTSGAPGVPGIELRSVRERTPQFNPRPPGLEERVRASQERFFSPRNASQERFVQKHTPRGDDTVTGTRARGVRSDS